MVHSSIDSILDASTIDAVRASSTATCEILDPAASSRRPVPLTAPRELTSDQLSELKGLLLDPQSWFFANKRCLPRAAALFRLQSDDCYVTVVIDMPCLGWIVTGPRGRWGGFFDPVQDQIRAMVKGLFPEYASSSRRSMWKLGVIAELRAAGETAARRGASMSEAEWLACTDSAPMLEYLRGKANGRKLRLFAAACCRAVWPMLTDKRSRDAVEAAGRSCEGPDAEEELLAAREAARKAIPSGSRDFRPEEWAAAVAAAAALDPDPETAARSACVWVRNVRLALAYEGMPTDLARVKAEVFARWAAESAALLRDIFGKAPFETIEGKERGHQDP